MKILLLGKNGQVGWELQRSLAPLGEVVSMGRESVNMENIDEVRRCVQDNNPNIIVNAAAYTAVDKAESEPEMAYLINSEAVGVLADEASKTNAWLIHYSTDYVFDGSSSSPYNEDDEPCPISIYGKSKLAGEQKIQHQHSKYLIFRTSWVYGTHGNNFAKTMLRLAKDKEELNVVSDQYGVPTCAELIADITTLAITKIIEATDDKIFTGIYHLAPNGKTSWHGFAQAIIERARHNTTANFKTSPQNIHPITTDEYPTEADRPKNSCLNTQKLQEKFNVYLPDWNYHKCRIVDELVTKETF